MTIMTEGIMATITPFVGAGILAVCIFKGKEILEKFHGIRAYLKERREMKYLRKILAWVEARRASQDSRQTSQGNLEVRCSKEVKMGAISEPPLTGTSGV